MSAPLLLASVLPVLLAFAAFSDLMTFKIPNWLALGIAAAFFALAPFAAFSLDMVLLHAGCGLAVLAGGFVLFSRGWIGGGDAKFAAAIALWLGWDELYSFLTGSAVAGGLLAVALLIFRSRPLLANGGPQWLVKLHTHGEGVPYGVAMSAAAILTYSKSAWIKAFLFAS